MPLTHGQIVDLMRHALGKTPDARHDLWATYNRAGREVFSLPQQPPHYHRWSWSVRYNQRLNIQPNSDVVFLPDDFDALISIETDDTTADGVHLTEVGDLHRLRASNVSSGLGLYVAIDAGYRRPDPSAPPRRVAALWPVPTEARTDVSATYYAAWEDVRSDQSANYPPVPPECESLLVAVARMHALAIENQSIDVEGALVQSELLRLVTADAGRQVDYGRPNHSVLTAAKSRHGGGRDIHVGRIIRT